MSKPKYNVRIGKRHNTVYVRTPKGRILRFNRTDLDRNAAKLVARNVRFTLNSAGETLNPEHWTVIK